MKVTLGQLTDRGLSPKRETNEDNLLVLPNRGLFLVADGVGGRRGGRIASQTVVDVFNKVFSQDHSDDLPRVIASAIDLCNQKIYMEAEGSPDLEGMASTVALVALQGKRAVVAHVGDSRVYRYDRQGLIGLTEDHSEVNDLVRAGMITEEQAAKYPRRNVINRAVGAESRVTPDIVEIEVDEHTGFLLCSDGITRHISDHDMERLLTTGRKPQVICEAMKELCYLKGAEDNLTVVIVDLGERNYPAEDVKDQNTVEVKQPKRKTGRIEIELNSEDTIQRAAVVAPVTPPPPAPETHPEPESKKSNQRDSQPQFLNSPGITARIRRQDEATKKGISPFMKWSLIILTLAVGIIVGVLFAKPIKDWYSFYFGYGKTYQTKGVPETPADNEVNAAYARFLQGHPDEARTRLTKALSEKPDNAEAVYYLGRIDLAENKFDDAVEHLAKAKKLNEKLEDVQIYLAYAYLKVGQNKNAMDKLQEVMDPNTIKEPAGSPTPVASPSATLRPSASPRQRR